MLWSRGGLARSGTRKVRRPTVAGVFALDPLGVAFGLAVLIVYELLKRRPGRR